MYSVKALSHQASPGLSECECRKLFKAFPKTKKLEENPSPSCAGSELVLGLLRGFQALRVASAEALAVEKLEGCFQVVFWGAFFEADHG